jgi:NAD(P)-dependent dehydrogenase (short-subunit alcohol dehydrogenase family)
MESQKLDVVIGAGSGIGRALIQRWDEAAERPILAVARSASSLALVDPLGSVSTRLCDYSDAALISLSEHLHEQRTDIARLIICNGVLQGDGYRPERALNQLTLSASRQVFEINTFLPMRILGALTSALKQSSAPRIAVLSARVGSIGDNQTGGWYSYRGSKAALNMMLKCAALELHRSNPATKLMAYHPGTVDTPLSKPFQAGIAQGKLFSPERAAEALDRAVTHFEAKGDLAFLDWQGEAIPW